MLPQSLLRVLEQKAQAKNLDLGLYVAELLSTDLDSKAKVELYSLLSKEYLMESEELTNKGNIKEAGERLWNSTFSLLCALGENMGVQHAGYRDVRLIAEELAKQDSEIPYLLDNAEVLHSNFYHNFLSERSFSERKKRALTLLEKLEKILESQSSSLKARTSERS